MIFEDLKIENELHKQFYKKQLLRIDNKFKEQFKGSHIYKLFVEDGILRVRNNIDNRNDCITVERNIFTLDDLLYIRDDTIGYIKNISLLDNFRDILNRVYLTEPRWKKLVSLIVKVKDYSVLEFKQVLDVDSFIVKSTLLGGFILYKSDLYTIIKLKNTLLVVSSFIFVVKTNSHVNFSNISCDTLIIRNFDTSHLISLFSIFEGTPFKNIRLYNFNTSNVKTMFCMFKNCHYLKTVFLDNFDVSNVVNFGYMFYGCTKLEKINVGNWDMSSAESIAYMFCNCVDLNELDLANWNTPFLQDMSYFVYKCINIKEIDIRGIINSLSLNIFGLNHTNWDSYVPKTNIKGSII